MASIENCGSLVGISIGIDSEKLDVLGKKITKSDMRLVCSLFLYENSDQNYCSPRSDPQFRLSKESLLETCHKDRFGRVSFLRLT